MSDSRLFAFPLLALCVAGLVGAFIVDAPILGVIMFLGIIAALTEF